MKKILILFFMFIGLSITVRADENEKKMLFGPLGLDASEFKKLEAILEGQDAFTNQKRISEILLPLVQEGNARAQVLLGLKYIYSKNQEFRKDDLIKAKNLLIQGATQGDKFGMLMLARLYAEKVGGTNEQTKSLFSNDEEMVKWLKLLLKNTNNNAEYDTSYRDSSLQVMGGIDASIFFSSSTLIEDCALISIDLKTIETHFFGRSYDDYFDFCIDYANAGAGDTDAQYKIASHFLEGDLVDKNTQTAMSWALMASNNGHQSAGSIIGEILIKDLVYVSDIQKLKDLAQTIETICSKNPKCAFDKVWEYLDLSKDGNLSVAELSKFQRNLVKFAYVEEMQDKVEIEEIAAINLTTILLLPITSSSILHSFDYNNDGTLQKEEVFGETEFAELVGIDAQSLISGVEFRTLGNKLNDAINNLPLPF